MGEIIGAGIVSHVPTMVLPKEERYALNNGKEISLVPGLERLRTEVFDRLKPDTVVVFDTHWFSLIYHAMDARATRQGFYTSDEIPTNPNMMSKPYDFGGDTELCQAVAALAADRDDTWVEAVENEHLPVHYGTLNLLGPLQNKEAWVPVSICASAEAEDFLLFGEILREAIESLDRRVVLLGAGSLSHKFWPLKQVRQHESSDPANITTPGARASDERIIENWKKGDHQQVLNDLPEIMTHAPEGKLGHYLMMLGAIGGAGCRATGEMYSDYESSAGTGQIHMWFERPVSGW
jgi:3,4-dihydroxyphenylacetate 2,3-dioxygenase